MIKRIAAVFLFVAIAEGVSFADVIHLKSGASVECMIKVETDDAVVVTVSIGEMTYPRDLIESVSKAGDEENTKLKKKWEDQKKQREAEQEQQRKLAAEQEKSAPPKAPEKKETAKEKPQEQNPPAEKPKEEKPLKSVDTINFYDKFTYRYAVRLPPNYNMKTKYPVLFCFDPGANGDDAAKRFAYAADKLNWIIVGSLDAHNGPWPPIKRAQEAMLKDIPKRFSVDEKRFYAAGLSGGARMSFCIARNHPDQFKGVIACGAGLDDAKEGVIRNVAVYLCVGKNDSNLGEMQELYKKLDIAHVKAYKNEFEGGHEWPSSEIISQALDWMTKQ